VNDYERIVYSLNVEDIQAVAVERFGRPLAESELKIVEDNLGDYIQWYDIIEEVITIHVRMNSVE
jgi:hypothetical protein